MSDFEHDTFYFYLSHLSYFLGNLNTVGTVENVSTSDEDIPSAPLRKSLENGPPLATPRRYLNNKEKSRGK